MKKEGKVKKKLVEAPKKPSIVERSASLIFFFLCIIIGTICVLTGIMGLFSSLYAVGSLYLIAGIFAFLPKRLTKMSNATKFLISFGALIVLFTVNASLNWNHSPSIANHGLGEEFYLDEGKLNLSMEVYSTQKFASILVDGKERKTTGYFLKVSCNLTNLGTYAVQVNPAYTIIDSQNKTYAGLGFSAAEQYFQPNLEKEIFFVIELPNSASGLKFQIRDNKVTHSVNLGI